MDFVYYPDYLEHHGILGMKWGIRRYQNEDGSWTKEGLDRRRSTKYINSDGSLTKQGIKKYSDAYNFRDLILSKHQKAVNDYDNGKLSKKALQQLEIGAKEYDFLNARQKVINKELKGAAIGSVVGALTMGSIYTATTLSTIGIVRIGALPSLAAMSGVQGAAIGTIVGSGMAAKDIDIMRNKESSFIKSLSKKKQAQYIADVTNYNNNIKMLQQQQSRQHIDETNMQIQQHIDRTNMHIQQHELMTQTFNNSMMGMF